MESVVTNREDAILGLLKGYLMKSVLGVLWVENVQRDFIRTAGPNAENTATIEQGKTQSRGVGSGLVIKHGKPNLSTKMPFYATISPLL